MQPDLYYLSILPQTLSIHKSIIYQVHPLNRYRLQLLRNSQVYDNTKRWVYAGNHNGVVQFGDTGEMRVTLDASLRTNFFSLRLVNVKYSLFKEQGVVNTLEKQQILGKHNLFIKKYLSQFTSQNTHSFSQHSHISPHLTLHYHVFIQRTPEGLNRIIQQHQRLNTENRPRKGSIPQSIKSSTFSDKINEIQIKGENRFADKAHEVMQGEFVGSESKLDPHFYSLNSKRRIERSGDNRKQNKNTKQLFKSRFYNQPFTETKTRDHTNEQNQLHKQPNQQEELISPPLQPLHLKKLTSQQVKVNFDLFSPDKLINNKLNNNQLNPLPHQQKKRKLLQEFQRKRLQFKKRIDSQKILGNPLPEPLTDRQFTRSNSMRSMRSVRSVRLTELERLPQEKPWVKKQKEKTTRLYKRVMYVLIALLIMLMYIVMQPNRNVENQETSPQSDDEKSEYYRERTAKKSKQKRPKPFSKK